MSEEKSAELSFSDWKKMKSALNSTEEKPKTKKNPAKKTVNNYNNKRQNNNTTNTYRGNSFDYRDQQNLQYFEQLKQRQMLMMQAALAANMARNGSFNRNNMGAFNNNNNMGTFNNDFGPFYNNRNSFNNLNPYNYNMNQNFGMNSFRNNIGPMPLMQQRQPPPPLMAQRQMRLQNNHGFADNYMVKGNDFAWMSDVPIPQQPFRQNKQSKNIPSLMSIRMQKRGITAGNKTDANNKNNETPTGSQKKPKPTKQKVNLPANKPTRPSAFIALNPVTQEAKQTLWREYRQNMKPFKNKDFLNAKRVIQRLKKKPFEELDEKEKERWEKANEFVNSHKQMLSERAIARGEAATARAAQVQNVLESEKNAASSPQSAETSSSVNDNNSPLTKNDSEQEQSENSNELPTSSGAAGNSTPGENWELWSSFVPGGTLFKS